MFLYFVPSTLKVVRWFYFYLYLLVYTAVATIWGFSYSRFDYFSGFLYISPRYLDLA